MQAIQLENYSWMAAFGGTPILSCVDQQIWKVSIASTGRWRKNAGVRFTACQADRVAVATDGSLAVLRFLSDLLSHELDGRYTSLAGSRRGPNRCSHLRVPRTLQLRDVFCTRIGSSSLFDGCTTVFTHRLHDRSLEYFCLDRIILHGPECGHAKLLDLARGTANMRRWHCPRLALQSCFLKRQPQHLIAVAEAVALVAELVKS